MKTFLIASICFVLTFVLLFIYMGYVQRTTDELTVLAESIEKSIEKGDWKTADDASKVFKEIWERKSKRINFFMDQKETDTVSEGLTALLSYIKTQNKDEAFAKVSAIKLQLRRLSEKEKPTLVNLLKTR